MIRRISLLIGVIVIACHSEREYSDKAIFRYNVAEGITSLDPAFARSLDNVSAVNQLFNGLVQTDENLNLKACIAKKWEVSDSGRTYRFILRKDVFFHEHEAFEKDKTRRVVADDFVYSFNRLVDPELLSPGKWVLNEVRRTANGSLDVIAENDSTLRIRLKRAFPPFLGILSMQYCAVVPKEVVNHLGDKFRSSPIGTGPFRFAYWKENTKLVYLRNEHYFEKDAEGNQLPKLDAVAISFIKDQEVAFLKFLQKELDYLSGLKGSYKDELLNSRGELRPAYQNRVNFSTLPYLNTEYLGFMLDPAYFQNHATKSKYLRKAMNYGFDREKMLIYLRSGIGKPAENGFIPQGLPSFSNQLIGYSYQPDSVTHYLELAGYPKGDGLPTIVLSTTAQYLDICEYLQSAWAKFGIPISIEVNQAATNNELIANAKAVFFRKSWVADYPDAENYLSLFKSENFAPNGPNYTHYSNASYDQWYEDAMNTTDDTQRHILYQKMDSLIVEDCPVIPLFYDRVVRFTQPTISELGVNPMNLLVLKYAKKSLK